MLEVARDRTGGDAAHLRRQPPPRDRQPRPRSCASCGTKRIARRGRRTSGTEERADAHGRDAARRRRRSRGSTSRRVTRSSGRCATTCTGRCGARRGARPRRPDDAGLRVGDRRLKEPRRDSEAAVRRRRSRREQELRRVRAAQAAAQRRSGTCSCAQEDQPAPRSSCRRFTLDQDELRKLAGATFYEERLLFLLIRLRNPRAHVVYVTSQPVHPLILDYYLHLLAGVPASHARARLTMLCAYDALAAAADAEDPRAAAPDRADPRGDSRSGSAPTSPSSTRRRSSASWRCCSASR